MQQQSKTEQVITRSNYQKHKQKLHQIKNNANNTSLQFYSAAKTRPLDRKKMLLLKMKREEIDQQNEYLRKKIEKINNTTTNQQFRRKLVSENENRKTSHSVAYHLGDFKRKQRYDKQDDTNKMEVNSDCGDGDSIKCFIPPLKNKVKFTSISQSKATDYNAIIFNLRQKEKTGWVKQNAVEEQQQKQINMQDNPEGVQNKDNNLQKQRSPSITMLQNPKIKQVIRNSTALSKDELLYNEPQREAHRIVLFKKTKIPYPMVSFLIEISLIDNRLLIIAYGMGIVSQDYKLLISRKRSRQISDEVKGNYEALWERVQVDVSTGIKIAGLYEYQQETQLDTFQHQMQKQKVLQQKRYEITQDFLQRNYYTLLKQQVNANVKVKQQNSIPVTHKQRSPVNHTSNTNQQKSQLKSVFRYKVEYKGKQENNNNQQKQQKQIKVKQKKLQGKTMEVRKQGRTSESKMKSKQDIKIKRVNNIKTNPSNNIIKKDTKQNYTNATTKAHSNTNSQNIGKKLPPLQQQQNYQQQFQQNMESSIKKTKGNKSNVINKSNEYEEQIENYSEDFSANQVNAEQEYPQQFVNQNSMEYESNPSKIMENKSVNSNMNKKKEMKNSSKVSGIEEQYSQFNEYEQIAQQETKKSTKTKKKQEKSKQIQKHNKQQIQQQYINQFESSQK